MAYERRIIQYSPDLSTELGVLSDRVIAGCWFELHRAGGCGAGELTLKDYFYERHQVQVGDWLAFEYTTGERWYLGRVQQRLAMSPTQVRLRLEGMGIELGEVSIGGFGPLVADAVKPHRFSRTDLFSQDPDHNIETVNEMDDPAELVRRLFDYYVAPQTHINYVSSLVETPFPPVSLVSLKFRGEETARAILKEEALRCRNATWGVDAQGNFFFLRARREVLARYRIGREILTLEEITDFDHIVNRVTLTGDYIYNRPPDSSDQHPPFYRWRGHYFQPDSRTKYGDKRLRMWVPWIRTKDDARSFLREFFRIYAEPLPRFMLEVSGQRELPLPWMGMIAIELPSGQELVRMDCETIRVEFDHEPRYRLWLGPEDPRVHWPEPAHNERWEVPGRERHSGWGGEPISVTSTSSSLPPSEGSSSASESLSSLPSESESVTSEGSTGSEGSETEGPTSDNYSSEDSQGSQTRTEGSGSLSESGDLSLSGTDVVLSSRSSGESSSEASSHIVFSTGLSQFSSEELSTESQDSTGSSTGSSSRTRSSTRDSNGSSEDSNSLMTSESRMTSGQSSGASSGESTSESDTGLSLGTSGDGHTEHQTGTSRSFSSDDSGESATSSGTSASRSSPGSHSSGISSSVESDNSHATSASSDSEPSSDSSGSSRSTDNSSSHSSESSGTGSGDSDDGSIWVPPQSSGGGGHQSSMHSSSDSDSSSSEASSSSLSESSSAPHSSQGHGSQGPPYHHS